MAIAVVQSIGAVAGPAAGLVTTGAFTSTAGTTLIAAVSTTSGDISVIDNGFLVWQLAGNGVAASYDAAHRIKMYYAPNVPGKVGHTVTAAVVSGAISISVIEVSGLALISRDQFVTAEGALGTVHTVGPLTPSDADQILVAAGSPYDNLAVPVTPATWTEQQNYAVIGAGGVTQIGLVTCTKIVASAAADSCAWTTVGDSRSISDMVSFSLTLQDPGGVRGAQLAPQLRGIVSHVIASPASRGDR